MIWKDKKFAEDYSKSAANSNINWYEYKINLPSLMSLIPDETQKILEFGCGAGDTTNNLSKSYKIVEGSDFSQAMIDICNEKHSGVNYFVWDGMSKLKQKANYYDLVFSKLTLQFVDDLYELASNLNNVLLINGYVLFSVPHPIKTIHKTTKPYDKTSKYETEIGSYGLHGDMIHRSLKEYTKPFLINGFMLDDIDEPVISPKIIKEHGIKEDYILVPRRLNLRFIKVNTF